MGGRVVLTPKGLLVLLYRITFSGWHSMGGLVLYRDMGIIKYQDMVGGGRVSLNRPSKRGKGLGQKEGVVIIG